MENEIVGDLMSEFGSLPDRAEDRQLDHLAEDLQQGFHGKLGKQCLSLIQKMVASKMPGGFGLAALREHMQTRWMLPDGHQDGILLSAAARPPESRLAEKNEAIKFVDTAVLDYAKEFNISLSSPSQDASPKVLAVDPEAMKNFESQQRALSEQLLAVYANSLNGNVDSTGSKNAELRDAMHNLQRELDQWTAEHGDAYVSGVQPMMSAKKARIYDSSWNWALMDLLRTYHDLVTGRLDATDRELEQRTASIANRSTPALLEEITYLERRIDAFRDSRAAATSFLTDLSCRCQLAWTKDPVFRDHIRFTAPETRVDADGTVRVLEVERQGVQNLADYVAHMAGVKGTGLEDDYPAVHIKSMQSTGWKFDRDLTATYLREMSLAASEGRSFANKTVLLTGAGPGSIGSEVLRGLLRGGASVVVTTSSFSRETTLFFQGIYATHGSRGSRLIVIPYNQGSVQDVDSLVRWIYDPQEGLGWDLDIVLPFAAIAEEGRDIDGLDARSELAHRIMLTNTIRLLGAIKRQKCDAGQDCRPAQVILPLSPNHGLFGHDGLYSESKMGLESLFRKSESEGWAEFLTICGAVIGWTRSTGLMSTNDIVAQGIESLGVRTFSQEEMAYNLLCLMTPHMVELCQSCSVSADLSGHFNSLPDFNDAVAQIRRDIMEKSHLLKSIKAEDELEASFTATAPAADDPLPPPQRLGIDLNIPKLRDFEAEVYGVGDDLHNMVDLERVVVVTGFGELGPFGSARTRWQVEAGGRLTPEGCVEMAWVMGMIKHHNGKLKGTQKSYSGWIDSQTGEPVRDIDVREKYEKRILEHTGIRFVEPTLWGGYNPEKHPALQEVVLEADLPEFEASREVALDFKRQHEHKVEISELADGQYHVRFKQGAVFMIPKAMDFDSLVTGQLPTGWDPRTYGIPEDIISQVDRTTLFVLICTVEALLSSGITDPYEMYEYVHLTEVGNCIGTGIGGATSLNRMHKGRYKDQPVQKDILQETFANTVTAWVNMLLLSSSGPLRTPVGACATSLESLDTAYDLIASGKARICLVGGVDDLEEDMAFEFAQMKATANGKNEIAKGRTPREMSRPTASSRAGFVESQGCGVQVVMSAKVALEMGVPIYGIVAFTGTSSDKAGRSVPAPGKGLMGNVRETPGLGIASPLLDINYRRKKLTKQRLQIELLKQSELDELHEEARLQAQQHQARDVPFDTAAFINDRRTEIDRQARKLEMEALYSIGNQFWKHDPRISPIRGALAVWGLTADDIDVASFHGTSTVLNEKNEMDILQRQLVHLGRTKGNRVLGVFQKHLTGHGKGAAGAWMLHGCLQIAQTGMVPGNANADNIDVALKPFDYLAVPNKGIQSSGVKALSVLSFGFGQKGAQAIVVHPRYLYAAVGAEEYERYRSKVGARRQRADQFMEDGMATGALVSLKTAPPRCGDVAKPAGRGGHGKGEEDASLRMLLDPTARVCGPQMGTSLAH